jgi:hypothetical protein
MVLSWSLLICCSIPQAIILHGGSGGITALCGLMSHIIEERGLFSHDLFELSSFMSHIVAMDDN